MDVAIHTVGYTAMDNCFVHTYSICVVDKTTFLQQSSQCIYQLKGSITKKPRVVCNNHSHAQRERDTTVASPVVCVWHMKPSRMFFPNCCLTAAIQHSVGFGPTERVQ